MGLNISTNLPMFVHTFQAMCRHRPLEEYLYFVGIRAAHTSFSPFTLRRRAEIERELASRADERVLLWIRHVERMDEYRMARRVLMAEVSGGRVRGRPRLGWIDGVKVAWATEE